MLLSSESSNTLNYLKCILCIGVVYIHSLYSPDVASAVRCGQVVDYQLYVLLDIIFRQNFLDETCVPLFFCISGFLFFCNVSDSFDRHTYLVKLKSRMNTLALPYIMANLMMILAVTGIGCIHGIMPNFITTISSFWAYNGTYMPIDTPTWYLRDLMVVCLFVPLIYFLIKYTGPILPIAITGCWLLDFWPTDVPGFGIRSFLFFSIGAFFALHNVDVIKRLNTSKYRWLYILAFVLLFVAYQFVKFPFMLKLSILASFPVWIALAEIFSRIFTQPCPRVLVTGTFFIFLYHFSLAHRLPVLLTKIFGH